MTDLNILVMEHIENRRSYYRLSQTWIDWLKDTNQPPPANLVQAHIEEYGVFEPTEFSIRTLQIVATDSNYIGDRIADLFPFYKDDIEMRIVAYGTSY